MKKFKMMALMMSIVAVGMMMFGCSKDDEDLIIGKWKVDKMMVNDQPYTDDIAMANAIYEFKDDNTCSLSVSMGGMSMTMNGKYTVKDKKLDMKVSASFMGETMEEEMSMNIDKLDKKEMVLSYTEMEEVEEGDGEEMEMKYVVTLKKQ